MLQCAEALPIELSVNSLASKWGDVETVKITIAHGGKEYSKTYPGKVAASGTTISFLNEILQPDYEIRFCRDSIRNDTGAFLPLSASQWSELENEFGVENMEYFFAKIDTK